MRIWMQHEARWMILLVMSVLMPATLSAQAQEINLDRAVKAGDLFCFPSLDDAKVFYYLADSPRLAVKDGRPQFSFLKYARTHKTGQAGTTRAEGGGLLHFLVTYGVDPARVRGAEKALQEQYPEARIQGPIIYRRGSFALVTSFAEGNKSVTKTVAVGKAPLMEGQKTAVSMMLTREGAELLWESFQTDTPDISLVFDMSFAGVREPYEATLEADWKRISKHHRVSAGLKYKWFGADVDMLFQELRQTGAVKITTKGQNAQMDKIIESANAKLLQVMFDPAPDELERTAPKTGGYSNLDRAVQLLKDAALKKTETKKKKTSASSADSFQNSFKWVLNRFLELFRWEEAFAQDNQTEKALPHAGKQAEALFLEGRRLYQKGQYQDALTKLQQSENLYRELMGRPVPGGDMPWNLGQCYRKLKQYEKAEEQFRRAAERYEPGGDERKKALMLADQMAAEARNAVYTAARRLDRDARESGYPRDVTVKALQAYEAYMARYSPKGERGREVEGRIRVLERKTQNLGGQEIAKATTAGPSEAKSPLSPSTDTKTGEKTAGSTVEKALDSQGSPKNSNQKTEVTSKKGENTAKTPEKKPSVSTQKAAGSAAESRSDGSIGFSLVASYKMKNIKRSGRLVYRMNHFRTETQSFAMAENIGNLYRRYGNDSRIFRAVTIDDPVFKQREILVTLDGQDTDTFTRYLNFVTVKMTKRHQNGDISTDEVVITPESFNKQGNVFELSYGFKGDHDRTRWLDYQVISIWSFHGGAEVRTPPESRNEPMLALAPPHLYRTLSIEGQGKRLTQAGVRHGVIQVTSMVNGNEISARATVRNQGSAPAAILDVPVDRDDPSIQAEITWFLSGGKQVHSGTKPVMGEILYWDEIPEGGV